MGASVEAVEAAGEATRASPALGETAAKAAPDSAPGPETARVDDAAPSLLGDSSSDAASARSPAPVSASRASSIPPASPSRHAPASVQELLGLRRLVDGGTPLTSAQARRAESLVKEAVGDGFASGNEYDASRLRLTSSELASLGLSAPSKPELPSNFDRMPLPRRLSAAQAFIDALTYNHVGGEGAGAGSTFFSIDKRRPVGRILETARCIERDALPIKCVEAVFLALRLTANWHDVDRVPAAFKTAVAFTDGAGKRRRRCHRHIVLLVRRRREPSVPGSQCANAKAEPTDLGAYGALGISRRASLAHRPMRYGSVSEILTSYREAYEDIGHEVLKVRVGLPVPRDPPEAEVCWRHCCVTVGRLGPGKGAAENGDDDDDDDDDDAEEAVASASSSSKAEKTDDAEADPAGLRTWEEAMAVFDAHDAASRSRKVFDKWRVDGERFAYVAPKEKEKDKEKEKERAKGGGANANGARAGTPPAAAAARDADDGFPSPVEREPSVARRKNVNVAAPMADDAPRLRESSPSADDDAGSVSGAATGEEASERAESPGAEASAEPPGEP